MVLLLAPPLHGGMEKGTYFRENTVKLDREAAENIFGVSRLERQASQRQLKKVNGITIPDDLTYEDVQLLSARNQQRLRKLRDLEGLFFI